MADGMMRLLEGFCERLERKPFLQQLTLDWESRVLIRVADEPHGISLVFVKGNVRLVEESGTLAVSTLQVTGNEDDLKQLFCGSDWALLKAKTKVALHGPIRDQLKWDALLRLTCASQ
ncbi:MAG: SCP-2 sterol transfer family protein [Clostridia bacterium]